MKCITCSNDIEQPRVEFGMKTCKTCAFRGGDVARYKGVMNWSHKTAPTIQVMSSECYDEQKKYYKPQGARSAVKNFSKHLCA
jgi:hypothetical protein